MQEAGGNGRTHQGYFTINLHAKRERSNATIRRTGRQVEIAQNAMDRVNKERIAKGQQPPAETTEKKETAKGGASSDAGQPT